MSGRYSRFTSVKENGGNARVFALRRVNPAKSKVNWSLIRRCCSVDDQLANGISGPLAEISNDSIGQYNFVWFSSSYKNYLGCFGDLMMI